MSSVVAPPAGAWIETGKIPPDCRLMQVAPPAGAWIETFPGQGLNNAAQVAPPAGAWIETTLTATTRI